MRVAARRLRRPTTVGSYRQTYLSPVGPSAGADLPGRAVPPPHQHRRRPGPGPGRRRQRQLARQRGGDKPLFLSICLSVCISLPLSLSLSLSLYLSLALPPVSPFSLFSPFSPSLPFLPSLPRPLLPTALSLTPSSLPLPRRRADRSPAPAIL